MKKRILSAFLAVLMVLSIMAPLSVFAEEAKEREPYKNVYESKEDRISQTMKLIVTSDDPSKAGASDGMLELYVDFETGEFAIKNKI